MKYYQGRIKLNNPEKYAGNPENCIYRSSWEARVYRWLDNEPNIVCWGSEEMFVPYVSPLDGKPHRYFPDVVAKVKTPLGEQIYMLEIKPYSQTQQPTPPKRKTKRFLKEVVEYGKNQAKWEAAKKYCKEQGWIFKVITEKDIFEYRK